jgi:hypothetical protein
VSTSSQRFRLPTNKVIIDQNIGRAIAVRDIAAISGYSIKFDIYKYAINISVPGAPGGKFTPVEPPVVLEGLESVRPPGLSTSIIQQRLNSSGAANSSFNEPQGELQAAGNIGDAGWYLRFNQPNITDPRNWNLSEAVVVRQNRSNDQVLGTQSPFWRSRNNGIGSYWGATTVYRNGFEAPNRFSGGSYSLNERLQARRGQLTANPIVRDISFTTFSGQIPVGADAFVISAGANRLASGNFGSFNAVQGGVLYRRGLTDTLTAGIGIAYDREVRGVGEFFWQPSAPLEIAATATTGSDSFKITPNSQPQQEINLTNGNSGRFTLANNNGSITSVCNTPSTLSITIDKAASPPELQSAKIRFTGGSGIYANAQTPYQETASFNSQNITSASGDTANLEVDILAPRANSIVVYASLTAQ